MLVLPHLLARPHVMALPALVAWCGALLAARDDERGPPWLLLPVMALWANLHGSFMFGLALTGFLGVGGGAAPCHSPNPAGRSQTLGSAFSSPPSPPRCATPTALRRCFSRCGSSRCRRCNPALSSGRPADPAKFPALEAWLLGAVALGFALRTRLPWTRLLLLLGLFHMALAHVRHADLLGLVGPLAVAAALGPALTRLLQPAAGSPVSRAAAALARPARLPACALILALALAASLPALLHPPARPGDAVTPQAALAAAQRLGLTGPVFNSESYGGYLIFSGVPVFIDGRIEMYGNDFLAAYIAAEQGDGPALAQLLDRYRIAWTLLRAGSPAVAAFDRLPGWRRAYADDQAVIHVRAD